MFALDHITLHGSQRPRLEDVSLTISQGRTAIVGYSGAGKTSLLNVLAGFELPDAGTVRRLAEGPDHGTESQGQRVRDSLHPSRKASERTTWQLPLYWVPQNGGLWPHLTVDQHLECAGNSVAPLRNGGKRADSGRTLNSSDEILAALDLVDRRKALPAELSQGERSRLALARALASRSRLLLLDEPLSHVDPVRKPDYWKAVDRWTMQDGTSMVFSSHEPETVLRQADQVVCLHDGRVVFQGATQTLYNSPPSREVGEFLGPLNWFEPEDAAEFLDRGFSSAGSAAVRPERLIIVADEASPLEFVAMPFRGSYGESIVKHVSSGKVRTVMHQAFGKMPTPGQRASLKVIGASETGEQS